MYKIVSDGTPMGTRVFFGDTELKNIREIAIHCGIEGISATIEVKPTLDIKVKEDNVQIS